MDWLVKSLPWMMGGLILLVFLLALHKPLEWLGRVLARTGLGLAVLFFFSKIGGLIGVTLGVNLINALIMGLLGVPGFGLLLMVNWVLAI